MQSPEDGLFQEYDRGERIAQRAAELSDDYEARLRHVGVDFDSDDAYKARAMLTLLAYRRVNNEVRTEELPEEVDPAVELPYLQNETRELQAELIISGMGKPWLALVDDQFPGNPLTESPEDIHFVADKMAAAAERTFENGEQFAQTVDKLHTFLQAHQTEPLTMDELQVLIHLAVLKSASSSQASEMDRINLFDSARGFLMRSEVRDSNVWHQLVGKFFADGPGTDNS